MSLANELNNVIFLYCWYRLGCFKDIYKLWLNTNSYILSINQLFPSFFNLCLNKILKLFKNNGIYHISQPFSVRLFQIIIIWQKSVNMYIFLCKFKYVLNCKTFILWYIYCSNTFALNILLFSHHNFPEEFLCCILVWGR